MAEKFKSFSGESEAMTFGRMLHQVFQQVLLKRQGVVGAMVGVTLRETVLKEICNVISTLESLDQL